MVESMGHSTTRTTEAYPDNDGLVYELVVYAFDQDGLTSAITNVVKSADANIEGLTLLAQQSGCLSAYLLKVPENKQRSLLLLLNRLIQGTSS